MQIPKKADIVVSRANSTELILYSGFLRSTIRLDAVYILRREN